jgi:hypothetical protein
MSYFGWWQIPQLARCAADQFNAGLAMGLIAGAAIAAGIFLFIKNSLSSLDTIGAARALCML